MGLGTIIGVAFGVLFLGIILYLHFWQKNSFNPLPSEEVDIDDEKLKVFAIQEKTVNFFIISDGKDYIAIDIGYGKKDMLNKIINLGLEPDKISHVFITHADFDHIGGMKYLRQSKFYLNKHDKQLIDGTTVRMFKFYKYPKVAYEFQLITGGEELIIGNMSIKTIATPGHTPGSTSYLINDSLLFSGDTLTLRNGKVHPFYKIPTMDMPRQLESIRNIAKLQNIKYLFSAHTGYTSNFTDAIKTWKI